MNKELIVVSYGCSYAAARELEIEPVEAAIASAFRERDFRRAYTASFINRKLKRQDGLHFPNLRESLEAALAAGAEDLLVQPTHLIAGFQYQSIVRDCQKLAPSFKSLKLGQPLLGSPLAEGVEINSETRETVPVIAEIVARRAGFTSAREAGQAGFAFVLMGHGTEHSAHISYGQLESAFQEQGFDNIFVGTVADEEGEELRELLKRIKERGFKKLELNPLMLVAGDHAHNDMAGDDDDSWLSICRQSGYFDAVEARVMGLGRDAEIANIYIKRAHEAQPIK
ncbi:MAG: sirohydrochlorin cobaltochelatase [Eubacteriales bacterium]|nr:sirohydrochlorin cobaltochelatase [Eubacteriales bacterium]